MSRTSQAMADGQPKFTWMVEEIESNEGRYKCTCENYPQVFAFGDTEQQAIRLANSVMEQKVDRAEI